MMRSPIPASLLVAFLLLMSSLGSCCLLCPSDCLPRPTHDTSIAEVALILDVKPEFRGHFMRMDELAQNRAVDRAWVQARAVLNPLVYEILGTHRLPVGPDGWTTVASRTDLANQVLGAAGLALDDPPKGCQRDKHPPLPDPLGSVKCDYQLHDLLVPAVEGEPELAFDLGFSIHCWFISRNPDRP